MAAHREWTERHIRELVQSELKKLKPSFNGVKTANRNISLRDFGDGRILSDLYMSDEVIHIFPDALNKDLEYKSFYYEMRYTGPAYYDGKLVFGIMPCNDERLIPQFFDEPIFNGLTYITDYLVFEFNSTEATYATVYAYQDGKFFSIRSEFGIVLPGDVLSHSQSCALLYGINPQDWWFEHPEWKDKFSNWSEYDFSRKRHYLYMELGYKKEE